MTRSQFGGFQLLEGVQHPPLPGGAVVLSIDVDRLEEPCQLTAGAVLRESVGVVPADEFRQRLERGGVQFRAEVNLTCQMVHLPIGSAATSRTARLIASIGGGTGRCGRS